LISLIICSRTATLSTELENNIKETIGVDYELVLINNQDNRYSIFEAYNLGVERSKYSILCFMHDDISYDTKNWGIKALAHFADEKTGAIGIAGTPYAAAMPGSWWGGGLVNICLLKNEPAGEINLKKCPQTDANRNEVLLLDGIWICIRKSLFNTIRFDDVNYKGFHFYDVDTCMQIADAGYKIYSVFNILMYHYTKGNNMNHNWNENALIFNKKWNAALPASCIKLSYAQKCEAEMKTLKEYIYSLIYNGHSNKEANKTAILQVLGFYRGYLYYKTPVQLLKYGVKYFLKPKTSV
jgi:hypothetical protein